MGLKIPSVGIGIQNWGRRTFQAPNRNSLSPIPGRIREGKPGRTTLTGRSLVDVSCCGGGGLVVATEVDELDVIADEIELGVDTKVVVANSSLETACRCGAIDDLVGSGDDVVCGGELEGAVDAAL